MNEPAPVPATGITRRTVVAAAAWSAPVIGLALAAPSAAATVIPPFNVQLDARAGDSLVWYNAATQAEATFYNAYNLPIIPYVSNVGPGDSPAGLVLTLQWDNRIVQEYVVTGARFVNLNTGDPAVDLPDGSVTAADSVLSGNTWTTIITINIPIPAGLALGLTGTRSFNETLQTDLILWPDLVPLRYEVTAAAGDTDPTDNVIENTPVYAANTPWDATAVVTWSTAAVDGCSFDLPASLAVTSTGPQPIPVGTEFYLNVDGQVVTSVGDVDTYLNGTLTPGLFTLASSSDSSTSHSRWWTLTTPIAVDDVLTFSAPFTLATTTAAGQVVRENEIGVGYSPSRVTNTPLYFRSPGVTCPA